MADRVVYVVDDHFELPEKYIGMSTEEIDALITAEKEKERKNKCEVAERLESIGITKGEERLAKLISLLIDKGLMEDVKKVTTDKKARQELYKKYGIH